MYMSVQTTRMNRRPGTVFAHFAALAFPSVALLREGLPQPFPIMVCTLSSVSRLDCPSLSFDLALRGLHGPGFDVRNRSQHALLTHGFHHQARSALTQLLPPPCHLTYLGCCCQLGAQPLHFLGSQ